MVYEGLERKRQLEITQQHNPRNIKCIGKKQTNIDLYV